MKKYQVINDNNEAVWFEEPLPVLAFDHAQALEEDGQTNVRVFEFNEGEETSHIEIWQSSKHPENSL